MQEFIFRQGGGGYERYYRGRGLADQRRHELYREYRTLVQNGHWRQVVDELKELAMGQPGEDAVMTELTYLRKHGEACRLSYPHFKRLGIPLGSGAIEAIFAE